MLAGNLDLYTLRHVGSVLSHLHCIFVYAVGIYENLAGRDYQNYSGMGSTPPIARDFLYRLP